MKMKVKWIRILGSIWILNNSLERKRIWKPKIFPLFWFRKKGTKKKKNQRKNWEENLENVGQNIFLTRT